MSSVSWSVQVTEPLVAKRMTDEELPEARHHPPSHQIFRAISSVEPCIKTSDRGVNAVFGQERRCPLQLSLEVTQAVKARH